MILYPEFFDAQLLFIKCLNLYNYGEKEKIIDMTHNRTMNFDDTETIEFKAFSFDINSVDVSSKSDVLYRLDYGKEIFFYDNVLRVMCFASAKPGWSKNTSDYSVFHLFVHTKKVVDEVPITNIMREIKMGSRYIAVAPPKTRKIK